MKNLEAKIDNLNTIADDMPERARSALVWRTVLTSEDNLPIPAKAFIFNHFAGQIDSGLLPSEGKTMPTPAADPGLLEGLDLTPEQLTTTSSLLEKTQRSAAARAQSWMLHELRLIKAEENPAKELDDTALEWLNSQLNSYLLKQQCIAAAQYAVTRSEAYREIVRKIHRQLSEWKEAA